MKIFSNPNVLIERIVIDKGRPTRHNWYSHYFLNIRVWVFDSVFTHPSVRSQGPFGLLFEVRKVLLSYEHTPEIPFGKREKEGG